MLSKVLRFLVAHSMACHSMASGHLDKMLIKWDIGSRFLWSLHHFKAIFKGYLMVQSILQAFLYLYLICTLTLYVPLLCKWPYIKPILQNAPPFMLVLHNPDISSAVVPLFQSHFFFWWKEWDCRAFRMIFSGMQKLRYGHSRSKGNKMLIKWVIMGRFLWSLHHFKAIFKGYLMVQSILEAFCYINFKNTFTLCVPLLRKWPYLIFLREIRQEIGYGK